MGLEGTMTVKEADRAALIAAVVEKRVKQREAADRLGLSVRQVKRLARRCREQGAAGMASARRGAPSNRAFGAEVRLEAVRLVRERYPDFGPTFAAEKLLEEHGLALSRETLRKWMTEDGLWRPKRRREARVHQRRPRRARLGELVQVDGSPHDWFEGRAPRCALIVFIDDATSRLLALRFCRSETTEAYMETLRGHLAAHGRPVALYSDRYSVFRVNRKDSEEVPTQFTRALLTLGIEPIHAGTPQAKGRVERANLTLQDRLVKEMRLRGIGGMEAANAYLPEFMADHNRRFAVAPREAEDAHRPVLHDAEELDLILCEQATRKLSKNLTFKFERREYQLVGEGKGRRLRGAAVTVCKGFDGAASVLLKGRKLAFRVLAEGEAAVPVADEKDVRERVDAAKAEQAARPDWKPAPDHPWRRPFKPAAAERAAA